MNPSVEYETAVKRCKESIRKKETDAFTMSTFLAIVYNLPKEFTIESLFKASAKPSTRLPNGF